MKSKEGLKMKKSAIYVRVSTSEQDPAMQLLDLKRYAQQRSFEIYKEYVDVGSAL
jgi:DNA invertase Pin-like site-specific DNA recombinase